MKKSRKTAALKEQRPFALLAKSRKKKAYRPAKPLAVYSRHRYPTNVTNPQVDLQHLLAGVSVYWLCKHFTNNTLFSVH
jgi:hypothetical protein